jgi:nucleotide-binding universal stress UspA family protein
MALERVLIAYDGSECATAALADLARAGFPDRIQLSVLTVSERWVPELSVAESEAGKGETGGRPSHGMMDLAQAEQVALEASEGIRSDHPEWTIRAESRADGAAWGIVESARQSAAELIVVGSHGRSALGRFVLGSVSQKVLAEAPCSVRIARAPWTPRPGAVRIIVGLDGSDGSWSAVEEVASRSWPQGSAVHLVSAVDPLLHLSSGAPVDSETFDPIVSSDPVIVAMRRQLDRALGILDESRLTVSSEFRLGDAATVLLDEAEGWGADAIFLGAKGHGVVERMLIGSVSATIATRARCSVEVVRRAS